MKPKMGFRGAVLIVAGMALSGCAADGTLSLPAERPAIYPPAVYAHRVGTSHVVLYWNCARPEPGVLRVEGVAQQAGSMQDVRFLELDLVGVDAGERHVSQGGTSVPDILLHTNQVSPFRVELRTAGTEVRFDLFYRYHFQDDGRTIVSGPVMAGSRPGGQNQRFMARDVCSETQHRVR